MLKLINCQLTEKGLKVEKASAAVIDATIIQTAGSKQRQAIEVDDEGQVNGQTTPSKDKDARWTKKNGLYKLGYKQHTRTDEEGYIEKLHITPANTHECNHLLPLLEGIAKDTTVYADKGYDSKENRQHLKEHRLLDGIMRKAHRNRPLTEVQTKRNRYLSKTRYVVEQSFGTLHRKFHNKLIGLAMLSITAMKIIRHNLNRNHIDIFRRLGIQSKTEFFLIHLIGQIKMNDLPQGMNPTISPTSTMNSDGLPLIESR